MRTLAALALAFLLASCGLPPTKTSKETAAPEQPKPEASKPAEPETKDLFSDVAKLRIAVSPVMSPAPYKDIGMGDGAFYGSSNHDISGTGFLPISITYSLTGKSLERVDKVFFKSFVASPGDLKTGREELNKVVSRWFAAVEKKQPDGLSAAIKSGKAFKAKSDGIAIDFTAYRGDGNSVKQPDGSSYRAWFHELTITP